MNLRTQLLALCCLMSVAVPLYGTDVNDLTWVAHTDGISSTITHCDPVVSGDLVIPETIKSKAVTSIADATLGGLINLASIGYEAFGCDQGTCHSGGTDSEGGHIDQATGVYHKHPKHNPLRRIGGGLLGRRDPIYNNPTVYGGIRDGSFPINKGWVPKDNIKAKIMGRDVERHLVVKVFTDELPNSEAWTTTLGVAIVYDDVGGRCVMKTRWRDESQKSDDDLKSGVYRYKFPEGKKLLGYSVAIWRYQRRTSTFFFSETFTDHDQVTDLDPPINWQDSSDAYLLSDMRVEPYLSPSERQRQAIQQQLDKARKK